jgi:hypothetical protein
VTLFHALQAFFQEHQYCGDLDAAVEGDRVWMTCFVCSVDHRRVTIGLGAGPRERSPATVASAKSFCPVYRTPPLSRRTSS